MIEQINNIEVDLSKYQNRLSFGNKVGRLLWTIVHLLLIRPFTLGLFNSYRVFIFNLFGASVSYKATVSANARVWAPWNLIMEPFSCLGPNVDCYNPGCVRIGKNSTVSQKAYLCTATHDITLAHHPLIISPITIKDQVWVAADAFIGPGVTIHQGAVVGARAAVFKDVEGWSVVGGNPAKFIKIRQLVG
ncbi:putative colanic acid biosynthesis acetyltransferase [Litoribacter ruber]|uniref:Colanic acid biosynthesis acetyltransferase n=1 Tax=Litoribacter ruber TaxID=702568 RepID=A0AAP2G0Z0_9BACT|nr:MULTISPECIES: putative colanic acid biosynthesis acetyltransferase [Litoribacter]MBS9523192.1 putative colanic acid biosynthesis acetyltransferase [Litoribacter alkaliphilus]MBT0810645.1 putative colanic acid biosynthesis acetyltransferase [Litoribacter ruber]